jgi:radical SAM protein with 4Fe4S-binding SPASM domain
MSHPRAVRPEDRSPIYAVWELTLRCDHACAHCGSRADAPRASELSREELLGVADQLAAMGIREVTVIGGEAYLHPAFEDVVRHLTAAGVLVSMQTGGLAATPRNTKRWKEAGLVQLGVSIDGPERAHDVLRARPGSHRAALRALEAAGAAGLKLSVNTQINTLNAPHLEETAELLHEAGVLIWRTQLTVPMGRAADRPDWILQPWQVVEVIDTLAALRLRYAERAIAEGRGPQGALQIRAGNNIGYYGPHEVVLRSHSGGTSMFWQGCQAGRYVISVESDGTIKPCPSLPTAPYDAGNVRDEPLQKVWETSPIMRFSQERTYDELWGFCATCTYATVCRAGCSFTAHCTLGRRGNNPFCYHRVTTLAAQGVRERLVHREAPQGVPYDFGRFELIEEPLPGAAVQA